MITFHLNINAHTPVLASVAVGAKETHFLLKFHHLPNSKAFWATVVLQKHLEMP